MRENLKKALNNLETKYAGNNSNSCLLGYMKEASKDKEVTKNDLLDFIEEYLIKETIRLEEEVESLKLTVKILEKKQLITKDDNRKLNNDNRKLNNDIKEYENNYKRQKEAIERLNKKIESLEKIDNQKKTCPNARGAGRKRKITENEIAEIQTMRAQGKTLQEIQRLKPGISYGNIQKYCKLISDNKKRASS